MKNGIYYDFHIHSCLSPCGDSDMTPNNIVNMAKLKGLDAIALTDHNACGNCEVTMKVGESAGLTVIPGMELCTSEDVHVVCLFAELEGALEFESYVKTKMPPIKNRPDIFGEQLFLDDMDNVKGSEDTLLITASGISVNETLSLCRKFGGTAFPAHADKPANGIIEILGAIPPEAGFSAAELSPNCEEKNFILKNQSLGGLKILHDSDAHYLWQISEKNSTIFIGKCNRSAIISYIDGFLIKK